MQTDPTEDYAHGWIPFLDCKIFLDSRPLIPRVETEYWVEKAINELIASGLQLPVLRILDLFAGSGAIGVALLKHLPETRVDFGEIDSAHFPTIEKNIHENGIEKGRTKIIQTDVWSSIMDKYDYIFANPPYLSESRKSHIQGSVLLHEPETALFAAENGFALIHKTTEGVAKHLTKGGALWIEHEPEQSEPLLGLARKKGLSGESRRDQFGLMRYSVLRMA